MASLGFKAKPLDPDEQLESFGVFFRPAQGGGGIQYINLKLNIYSYMGLHVIFHGMIFSCDVHKKTEHNLKLL